MINTKDDLGDDINTEQGVPCVEADRHDGSKNSTGNEGGVCERYSYRFRHDQIFRRKFVTASSLLWAYAVLGWATAQMGPSFLDLQIITGTGLDQASLFFTFNAGGYLVGSLIVGIVYDRFVYDRSLVNFVPLIANTAVLISIPWCTRYEVMVFVHGIRGILSGGFETCGNAYLIQVCGNDNAALMQALYFVYAIGGMISPYAISPFLAKEPIQHNVLQNTDASNVTSSSLHMMENEDITVFPDIHFSINKSYVSGNSSNSNVAYTFQHVQESRLYIGYSITALLTMTSAIPFLLLFLNSKCKREIKTKVPEEAKPYPKRSFTIKIAILVAMCIIMGLTCGIEDSFNNFLASFCVKQLRWTKVDAATVTSIYWASIALGRFIGIFSIKRFKPSNTATVLCFSLCASHVGFLLVSKFRFDPGVWIFGILVGLFSSVIFPLLFTWVEEDLFPVTGKIASVLMITANAGATINPIVVGYTMDNLAPIWFSYSLVIETVLTLVLCFFTLIGTRKNERPNQENSETEAKELRPLQKDTNQL